MATRRPPSKRKPTARRSAATAAPVGPLTLEQARRMAQDAAAPKRRALPTGRRRGLAAVAPEVGVVELAVERRKRALTRRAERKRRIAEYAAIVALMQAHGVRKAAPKARRRAPSRAPKALPLLKVLAEGDSWFDFPRFLVKGGIVKRLERRLGVPVLNLADAGDEVRYMLGVEQRRILTDQLRRGSPAGGPWDVLLFSGGGNDIVDDPMALWVRDHDPMLAPADHVHAQRFGAALAVVAAGYEDLIKLRDSWSPTTHLVFHCYDWAIPSGRKVCHLGPWLKPTFDLRGFPLDLGFRAEVVKAMLRQFAAMLKTIAPAGSATVIDAQGTLAPDNSGWNDELHPSDAGFDRFAKIFHDRLKALFPGRLP